jgi:type I restriction enzyme M protein
VLFIDCRKLGTLIPGSRKQKQLDAMELERIAGTYHQFKRDQKPSAVPGFCCVATLDEVRSRHYALTPGRYVGSENQDDADAPLEERLPKLLADVEHHLTRSAELGNKVLHELRRLSNEA